MGLDNRRPPLPAPTETSNDEDTEVNTQFTGRTTYVPDDGISLPPDGRPITISTQKISAAREGGIGRHGRNKSQTSLLIEYFEASKTGDKSRSRPSVRVKVTPSAHKKTRSGNEAIQITGIGSDRKPSYTRRISLGTFSNNAKIVEGAAVEGTEVSRSSDSNVSSRPPLEIEVINNESDTSTRRSSRGLNYAPVESNVSSMPPDSMLEGETHSESEMSRGMEQQDAQETVYLKAPVRTGSQSRSDSKERLAQKVMEKLGQPSSKPRKSDRPKEYSSGKEYDGEAHERRRKASRSRRSEEDTVSGAESSLLSNQSQRSGASQASRMTNNPKLLEMVEDTIKRMILPEINAIKEDQRTDRKLRDAGNIPRGSGQTEDDQYAGSPKYASKPKVVLNRDGDDPGIVLSRGDSERVKHHKPSREGHSEKAHSSSRRSSGHSRRESYDDDQNLRPRSSKSSNGLRGAAAAGLVSGALTAAALRDHDSHGDKHERRKKRSKSRSSRSHSASITEKGDEAYSKKTIPPMPLGSHIHDSDMTRESLLSRKTEFPLSDGLSGQTPTRESSHDIRDALASPASSRTLAGASKHLGTSQSEHLIDSPNSPKGGISNRGRVAALAAAGLGGFAVAKGGADSHMDADGYGSSSTQRKISSPVHSISSLKKNFEDGEPLVPQASRPLTPASRSSAGRLHSGRNSQTSLRSAESSPTTKLGRSRQQSHDALASPVEPAHLRERASPGVENADEWYEQQLLVNDHYRNSMATTTNRDSYQTNPYPHDEKRYTMNTDDSYDQRMEGLENDGGKDLRDVGQNMNYVHTPVPVESAVASLMEPSTVSSNMMSTNDSPGRSNKTYSDRMAEHLRAMGNEKPAIYEGSTLSQTMPSQDRWAALKGQAVKSVENVGSPRQSPARSLHQNGTYDNKPTMVVSGLPLADDPMPEIGHYNSQSDLTTNPSIIHGPLGGDATGKDTWPYTPEPHADVSNRDVHDTSQDKSNGVSTIAGPSDAAPTAAHAVRQQAGNVHREGTPTGNSPAFRDEGYVTDGRARSTGDITPRVDEAYGKKDIEEYERAMDAQNVGGDDPFASAQHARNFSGNSHGMASPLYDSSTGKGIDRIQSHDVVALMDHLTVRDAQRNARDTEILVTLVRSAAEMRQSFDEIKKFITEQDKLIMQTTDRNAEYTAQRVLSGPRPQPLGSPRTPRRAPDSEEDIQTKRKGVLRRALKGLTGGKSAKDLARIEDMLMQILDNVEDLKHQNGGRPPLERSYTEDTVDSYEKLRAAPDSGYEPEGQAGTSSTPSHSGHFVAAPREKQQFHSGYDGRRGSDNRVSTVAEDDEDELEPHERLILSHQFENNERLSTPTQELYRARGLSPNQTPPPNTATLNTPEKQAKHKSNSSSLFGVPVPKISRWSKTTASSAAPDPTTLDSPKQARNLRPSSEASRSESPMNQYDDDQYSVSNGDRLNSTQSLARRSDQGLPAESRSMRSARSQGSRLTRTPSPLIPSEASTNGQYGYYDDEREASPVQEDEEALFEDPKYQAHRNSLLLEHPQPRQGPTPRHQNALESQAQTFDDQNGTNSDLSQRTVSDFDPAVWGSAGTAGLARHRLTHVEPLSPVSMNSPGGYTHRAGSRDDSLMPQQQKPPAPSKVKYEPQLSPEPEFEQQFSNSGFSKDAYSYSSPYGSGHLLEPIPEVRMSLETDSGRLSPDAFSLASAKAVHMRSPGRKITGPRPMSASSPNAARTTENTGSGTVRRKPVPRSQPSVDSLESETL